MAVAAMVGEEPVGLAVSAFVSVSLDPPLMAICIDRMSRTWSRLSRVPSIGVSVIAENQAWLGRQLAQRDGDRFAGADFEKRPSGALFLAGSVARFETQIEETYPGGDHDIVLLRVADHEVSPEFKPLVWHDRAFVAVSSPPS
jgi:flavin reductase (DIM6/NTAB) family NADH-FMN oxidoreductase RutF